MLKYGYWFTRSGWAWYCVTSDSLPGYAAAGWQTTFFSIKCADLERSPQLVACLQYYWFFILYWPPHPHTHPCVLCQYSYLLSISWCEEVWKCLVEFRYTEYLKLVREQHSFTQSYFILTLLRKEKKLMLPGATVYEEFENSPMSSGFLWGLWFYLTSQRCSR